MRLLALDIATKTGWAFGDASDKKPRFGSIQLPKSSELGEYGRRFSTFRRELIRLVTEFAPQAIWYEAPMMKDSAGNTSINTIRVLTGLAGFAEEVAHTYGLQCAEATSKEVRKHFIGYSTGKSDELKLAVMKQCHLIDWTPANYDESDALALWSYGQSRYKLARLTK